MKQQIIFLRHGQMQPPYQDYSLLPYGKLALLSRRQVEPRLDREANELLIKRARSLFPLKPRPLILCSTAKRTQDTAALLFPSVPSDIQACLNEIPFDLTALLTEAEFQKHGMPLVRTRFFEALMEGRSMESLREIWLRLASLDEYIRTRHDAQILCITHGFLLRCLQLYFLHGERDPAQITLEKMQAMVNYSYLDGFVCHRNISL